MKKILVFSLIVFVYSCKPSGSISNSTSKKAENISLNGKLFTALFMQSAAEYRALCYQGYNSARMQIENYKPISNKPLAIVTDIDETILDNSPFAVHQAWLGKEYVGKDWYDWTKRESADTLPGAGSLLNYAASKGVSVFYITNRDGVEKTNTINNLKKFGLPYADFEHVYTKENTSGKEARRQRVSANYEIVLLMGDNLSDFSEIFDKQSWENRKSVTDQNHAMFGHRFIVFPNPNYGDWEGALYKYKYNFTQAQKDSLMRSVLKGY